MPPIAILILAAGSATRMLGRDKLMEPIRGVPLLRRIAETALKTGHPVYVALPQDARDRLNALSGLGVTQLEVESPEQGMSQSLRAGLRVLPHSVSGAMIMLADMPEITTSDLTTLADQFAKTPDRIVRACDDQGHQGHPVIFPSGFFTKLADVTGDKGARDILKSEKITLVELPRGHATTDLDTPEDWIAWRRANPLQN